MAKYEDNHTVIEKISDCHPKTRNYFTETKIFIKISVMFNNLFQSVREKMKIEKVVHEKLKSNVVNRNNF